MAAVEDQITPPYDVAISFLAADQPFAEKIADALGPVLRTFVYSRAQPEVVGLDGSEAFRQIFGNKCSLVVVLHRKGWGTQGWTRIELGAIQERHLEQGPSFLLIVRMDDTPLLPWMPKTRLYFSPSIFPLGDLVAAIRARCAEQGVEIRPPTIGELARAQHERELFDKETQRLLDDRSAYDEQVQVLVKALEGRALQISEATSREVKVGEGMYGGYAIRDDLIAMDVMVEGRDSGNSRDASVRVRFFSRRIYFRHERRSPFWREPEITDRRILYLRRRPESGWVWQMGDKQYPPAAIADVLAARFLELRSRYVPAAW